MGACAGFGVARPFADLVARIGATRPRAVVDLGCGPGELTVEDDLGQRWFYWLMALGSFLYISCGLLVGLAVARNGSEP